MLSGKTLPPHRPVMLTEAIAALAVRSDGIYVDATFGAGGHSEAILARLGPSGRLVALDRDPEAIARAHERFGADARVFAVHAPFSRLGEVLERLAIATVQGVLVDLGVSTLQLATPVRGFSFDADGPLDMRMDPTTGWSAGTWLARASESDIREVLRGYGEERFAKQVAAAIVAARRRRGALRSTRELAEVVAGAVRTREPGQHPATRTFQALRILVNRELEEVALMLPQAVARLAPGGRLVVIAFHSLEDRIVKRFYAELSHPMLPRDLPLPARALPQPVLRLVGRVQRPGAAELASNPRARSARLRVAERTAAPFDPAPFLRTASEAWRN